MKSLKNQNTKNLVNAIDSLKNEKEVWAFMCDLLTEKEIAEFGRRWEAAKMLDRKVPYTDIVKETGLSSTTVARVSKWLSKGEGGYRLMIDRMHHQHKTSS